MPTFKRYTAEELESLTAKPKSERAQSQAEYQGYLAELSVGDGGELTPEEGEKRLTVKNRLKAAAKASGKEIEFLRTRGEAVRFKVTGETEPVVPKRRGGRPRKQEPEMATA
jgi:hypothetical protein